MAAEVHANQLRNSVAPPQDASVPATAPPAVEPMEEVLTRIRRDSRSESRQYLDETAVPHGGE
jgi:hypothetical protein